METIARLGGSEAVERRLKAEEAKLVEMRARLTALARSGRPKERPTIHVDALVADLRSLRTLSDKDPAAAGRPSSRSSRASR